MGTTDVKCPECGAMNYSLYLDETDGWMECDHCGCTARLRKEETVSQAAKKDSHWRIIRVWPVSRMAV